MKMLPPRHRRHRIYLGESRDLVEAIVIITTYRKPGDVQVISHGGGFIVEFFADTDQLYDIVNDIKAWEDVYYDEWDYI